MSTLEQSQAILDTLRADLKREKEAVIALLKRPRIAAWQAIDLKKNKALLAGVGIDPAAIDAALIDYQQQAKKIGKQICDFANEIGNQQADLIGHPDPDLALAKAVELQKKIQCLTAMHEELLTCILPFMEADKLLRQQLAIKPMLAIARFLSPGRKEFFSAGLETLALLIPNTGEEGSKSLQEFHQEPPRLEARFQRLDITRLPRLVEEILFQYIEEAVAATKEIGIFLQTVNDRVARELLSIGAIERNLSALQSENTADLLDGITVQANQVANLLSSLYHKRHLKATMTTIHEALEFLNVFSLLLKNRVIPELQQEVATPGAPLLPATIAATMTRSFFTGATGIIRSLKLMIASLTGKAAINDIELQLTLEQAIMNCKVFYGKSREDLKKMQYYIDSMVGHYPRPFPYNDLCKLTKSTLTAYGEGVEKFIQGYEIPKEMRPLNTGESPTKVGLLATAITRHKTVFQKANNEE